MKRSGLTILGTAAAGLLLMACGGSGSSSSTQSSPSPSPTQEAKITSVDACKLVTEADASAAVGTSVANMATSGGASIPGACIYVSGDGQATVLIFAQTYQDTRSAEAVDPAQIAAVMNGQYGVSNAKPVSGIGDKALEYTVTNQAAGASPGGNGIAIFVFKSNVVLFIVMTPSTSSSAIEQLAKTAVGRL